MAQKKNQKKTVVDPRRMAVLKDMFSYRRPMGSSTERAFVNKYVANLPNAERDEFGNWHVTVDDAPVLWSCHTDTVHDCGGRQEITVSRGQVMSLSKRELKSNCLGADDTAGVFLLREMVLAGVPGHYVFHYGEERGCVGSSKLAKRYPDFLRLFKFAIAFDRQGTADVITHQSYGRTASDAFAVSLAEQLGGFYKPCSHGIYTDTNEYAALIPECTNVSVGYYHAHRYSEVLDVAHLLTLLDRLLVIDVEAIDCERDPNEKDTTDDDRWADYYLNKHYAPFEKQYADAEIVAVNNGDRSYVQSLDDYLDPITAEVNRELERQLRDDIQRRFKNNGWLQ